MTKNDNTCFSSFDGMKSNINIYGNCELNLNPIKLSLYEITTETSIIEGSGSNNQIYIKIKGDKDFTAIKLLSLNGYNTGIIETKTILATAVGKINSISLFMISNGISGNDVNNNSLLLNSVLIKQYSYKSMKLLDITQLSSFGDKLLLNNPLVLIKDILLDKAQYRNNKRHDVYEQTDSSGVYDENEYIDTLTLTDNERKSIIQLSCTETLSNNLKLGPIYPLQTVNYSSYLIKCPSTCFYGNKTYELRAIGVGIHPEESPICISAYIDNAMSVYGGIIQLNISNGLNEYIGKSLINNLTALPFQKSRRSFTVSRVENIDMVRTDVRILNNRGEMSSLGRLEIKKDGVWGTVCGIGLSEMSATVVCKDLGYENGIYLNNYNNDDSSSGNTKSSINSNNSIGSAYCRNFKGSDYCGNNLTPVNFSEVKCQGKEKSILDCPKKDLGSNINSINNNDNRCTHDFDTIIKCFIRKGNVPIPEFDIRLVNTKEINVNSKESDIVKNKIINEFKANSNSGSNKISFSATNNDEKYTYGRLEVFLNSWGTVCDHLFNNTNAEVLCKQLNYLDGFYSSCSELSEKTNGSIELEDKDISIKNFSSSSSEEGNQSFDNNKIASIYQTKSNSLCGPNIQNISLSQVQCKSEDNHLHYCRKSYNTSRCTHFNDVVLICRGNGDPNKLNQQPSKKARYTRKYEYLPLQPMLKADCKTNTLNLFFRGNPGSVFSVQCPKNCLYENAIVRGNVVYTRESSICQAAIHTGVINNTGGTVAVVITYGQRYYFGENIREIATLSENKTVGCFFIGRMNSSYRYLTNLYLRVDKDDRLGLQRFKENNSSGQIDLFSNDSNYKKKVESDNSNPDTDINITKLNRNRLIDNFINESSYNENNDNVEVETDNTLINISSSLLLDIFTNYNASLCVIKYKSDISNAATKSRNDNFDYFNNSKQLLNYLLLNKKLNDYLLYNNYLISSNSENNDATENNDLKNDFKDKSISSLFTLINNCNVTYSSKSFSSKEFLILIRLKTEVNNFVTNSRNHDKHYNNDYSIENSNYITVLSLKTTNNKNNYVELIIDSQGLLYLKFTKLLYDLKHNHSENKLINTGLYLPISNKIVISFSCIKYKYFRIEIINKVNDYYDNFEFKYEIDSKRISSVFDYSLFSNVELVLGKDATLENMDLTISSDIKTNSLLLFSIVYAQLFNKAFYNEGNNAQLARNFRNIIKNTLFKDSFVYNSISDKKSLLSYNNNKSANPYYRFTELNYITNNQKRGKFRVNENSISQQPFNYEDFINKSISKTIISSNSKKIITYLNTEDNRVCISPCYQHKPPSETQEVPPIEALTLQDLSEKKNKDDSNTDANTNHLTLKEKESLSSIEVTCDDSINSLITSKKLSELKIKKNFHFKINCKLDCFSRIAKSISNNNNTDNGNYDIIVYGTYLYHASSSLCYSAIHSGLFTRTSRSNYFIIQIKSLKIKYYSSFLNNIYSKDLNANESLKKKQFLKKMNMTDLEFNENNKNIINKAIEENNTTTNNINTGITLSYINTQDEFAFITKFLPYSFLINPISEIKAISCSDSIKNLNVKKFDKLNLLCPSGCFSSENSIVSNNNLKIYGNETYSDISCICLAAIHSGVISNKGGEVDITIKQGLKMYYGSKNYGVESFESGKTNLSFSFMKSFKIYTVFEEKFHIENLEDNYEVLISATLSDSNSNRNSNDNKTRLDSKDEVNNALDEEDNAKHFNSSHDNKSIPKRVKVLSNNKNISEETPNVNKYFTVVKSFNSELNKKVKAITFIKSHLSSLPADYGTILLLNNSAVTNIYLKVTLKFIFSETAMPVIGLIFRHFDNMNYYSLRINPNSSTNNCNLISKKNGSTEILSYNTITINDNEIIGFTILAYYDSISLFIVRRKIEEMIFELVDDKLSNGSIGLGVDFNYDKLSNDNAGKKKLSNQYSSSFSRAHNNLDLRSLILTNTSKPNYKDNNTSKEPIFSLFEFKVDNYIRKSYIPKSSTSNATSYSETNIKAIIQYIYNNTAQTELITFCNNYLAKYSMRNKEINQLCEIKKKNSSFICFGFCSEIIPGIEKIRSQICLKTCKSIIKNS